MKATNSTVEREHKLVTPTLLCTHMDLLILVCHNGRVRGAASMVPFGSYYHFHRIKVIFRNTLPTGGAVPSPVPGFLGEVKNMLG